MADQAKVTSIDALEAFRSDLILFIASAHQSLDEVGDDVRRTRQWIETEQRAHWESELRRRTRVLEQATQELMSARLSDLRGARAAREAAVARAKKAVTHADEKLRVLKRWKRDYEDLVEPLTKRLGSLRQVLDRDLPKALAYLVRAQATLEEYAASTAPAHGIENQADSAPL